MNEVVDVNVVKSQITHGLKESSWYKTKIEKSEDLQCWFRDLALNPQLYYQNPNRLVGDGELYRLMYKMHQEGGGLTMDLSRTVHCKVCPEKTWEFPLVSRLLDLSRSTPIGANEPCKGFNMADMTALLTRNIDVFPPKTVLSKRADKLSILAKRGEAAVFDNFDEVTGKEYFMAQNLFQALLTDVENTIKDWKNVDDRTIQVEANREDAKRCLPHVPIPDGGLCAIYLSDHDFTPRDSDCGFEECTVKEILRARFPNDLLLSPRTWAPLSDDVPPQPNPHGLMDENFVILFCCDRFRVFTCLPDLREHLDSCMHLKFMRAGSALYGHYGETVLELAQFCNTNGLITLPSYVKHRIGIINPVSKKLLTRPRYLDGSKTCGPIKSVFNFSGYGQGLVVQWASDDPQGGDEVSPTIALSLCLDMLPGSKHYTRQRRPPSNVYKNKRSSQDLMRERRKVVIPFKDAPVFKLIIDGIDINESGSVLEWTAQCTGGMGKSGAEFVRSPICSNRRQARHGLPYSICIDTTKRDRMDRNMCVFIRPRVGHGIGKLHVTVSGRAVLCRDTPESSSRGGRSRYSATATLPFLRSFNIVVQNAPLKELVDYTMGNLVKEGLIAEDDLRCAGGQKSLAQELSVKVDSAGDGNRTVEFQDDQNLIEISDDESDDFSYPPGKSHASQSVQSPVESAADIESLDPSSWEYVAALYAKLQEQESQQETNQTHSVDYNTVDPSINTDRSVIDREQERSVIEREPSEEYDESAAFQSYHDALEELSRHQEEVGDQYSNQQLTKHSVESYGQYSSEHSLDRSAVLTGASSSCSRDGRSYVGADSAVHSSYYGSTGVYSGYGATGAYGAYHVPVQMQNQSEFNQYSEYAEGRPDKSVYCAMRRTKHASTKSSQQVCSQPEQESEHTKERRRLRSVSSDDSVQIIEPEPVEEFSTKHLDQFLKQVDMSLNKVKRAIGEEVPSRKPAFKLGQAGPNQGSTARTPDQKPVHKAAEKSKDSAYYDQKPAKEVPKKHAKKEPEEKEIPKQYQFDSRRFKKRSRSRSPPIKSRSRSRSPPSRKHHAKISYYEERRKKEEKYTARSRRTNRSRSKERSKSKERHHSKRMKMGFDAFMNAQKVKSDLRERQKFFKQKGKEACEEGSRARESTSSRKRSPSSSSSESWAERKVYRKDSKSHYSREEKWVEKKANQPSSSNKRSGDRFSRSSSSMKRQYRHRSGSISTENVAKPPPDNVDSRSPIEFPGLEKDILPSNFTQSERSPGQIAKQLIPRLDKKHGFMVDVIRCQVNSFVYHEQKKDEEKQRQEFLKKLDQKMSQKLMKKGGK